MRILVICNITIREQEIGMRVSGLRERLNEMGVAGDIYAINSVEYPNENDCTAEKKIISKVAQNKP